MTPLAKPLTRAFAKYVTRGTVAVAEQVTPTMRRIRIVADTPWTTPHIPGQHVRIQLTDPLSLQGILHPIDTLRSYTIWDHTAAESAIELRVHLYRAAEEGIGLRWARAVTAGDPVTFWGPQGDFATRSAPYHLFIGDETATAAFGPMLGALGATERVLGVLESESAGEDLHIPGRPGLRRVYRHGEPAYRSPTLLAAVAALDLPDEPGAAYVAGEARTCQQVRDHLVRERGWPRRAITVKPFWTPGRRGLH
ncbi:siderophore-interacting protein [Actinophytocola sediminis]